MRGAQPDHEITKCNQGKEKLTGHRLSQKCIRLSTYPYTTSVRRVRYNRDQGMSFSYNDSMEAWRPAEEGGGPKIRVLEVHPLPWFLRWVPQSWESYIPLRTTLAWAPLAETVITKNNAMNAGKCNASSESDAAVDCLTDRSTSIEGSTISSSTELRLANSSSTFSSWSPPYKALSYTWGDGLATTDVLVNGKNLTITRSLATALFHLRPRSRPLRIWIDQICINQDDLKEKTEQVRHMHRVYRISEESLIWLGPAQLGSDTLMDVFNKLGAFAERFDLYNYYTKAKYPELFAIETKKNPEDPKTIEYHAFCDSVMDHFTYAFFEALIVFYTLPWFHRAWCVQEYSLPPRVVFVYGTKRINGETLMCVLQMIILTIGSNIIKAQPHNRPMMAVLEKWNDVSHSITPFFSSRQRRKQWDSGEREGDRLYDILHRVCVSAAVKATQGCDMVYGLLGLVNDAERLRIRAEYSEKDQQKQAAITYTKTARAIVESGKVDLLTSAQHVKTDMTLPSWVPDWRSGLSHSFAERYKENKTDGLAIAMCRKLEQDATLPSWVPDWRLGLRKSFAWLSDIDKDLVFRASNDQPLKAYEVDDDRILALDGYIVDEVEDLGGPWLGGQRVVDGSSSRFPHEEYLNLLYQIRQMCIVSKTKNHDIYPTSEEADDAYWRIPTGGIDSDETFTAIKAGPALKLKYEHCMAELENLIQVYGMTITEYEVRAAELVKMGEKKVDDEDPGRNTGSMYRVRMQEMAGKRPFISKVGYVGMGPAHMRIGDKIAILNGASVPFIVRPVDEDRFRLMGESYCDGIMFGEFVQRGARVQKIVLV